MRAIKMQLFLCLLFSAFALGMGVVALGADDPCRGKPDSYMVPFETLSPQKLERLNEMMDYERSPSGTSMTIMISCDFFRRHAVTGNLATALPDRCYPSLRNVRGGSIHISDECIRKVMNYPGNETPAGQRPSDVTGAPTRSLGDPRAAPPRVTSAASTNGQSSLTRSATQANDEAAKKAAEEAARARDQAEANRAGSSGLTGLANSISSSHRDLSASLPPADSDANRRKREEVLARSVEPREAHYAGLYRTVGLETNRDLLERGPQVAESLKQTSGEVNKSAENWERDAERAENVAKKLDEMKTATERNAERLGSDPSAGKYPTRMPASLEAKTDYPRADARGEPVSKTRQGEENFAESKTAQKEQGKEISGKGGDKKGNGRGKLGAMARSEEVKVKEILAGKKDGSSAADILAAAKAALEGMKENYGKLDARMDPYSPGQAPGNRGPAGAADKQDGSRPAQGAERFASNDTEGGAGSTASSPLSRPEISLFERVHGCYRRQASL